MLEPTKTAQSLAISNADDLAASAQTPGRAGSVSASVADIETLLWRMRQSDRDAAAQFLVRYGSRIRRRIRGKLGPAVRRLFDSMDILSTLGRRLDLYVMSGRLQVASEAQLWSLLFKMADHALVDKARVIKMLQHTEGEDSDFAHEFARRLRHADRVDSSGAELEIDKCLRHLPDPVDRRILSMWLASEPYAVMSRDLDLDQALIRKRWERIKLRLKEKFAEVA